MVLLVCFSTHFFMVLLKELVNLLEVTNPKDFLCHIKGAINSADGAGNL